ncbi:MAG: hypothetical protein SF339_02685 [Blastocatellia bacterium]|nr:hypothetical protein [Blastocatellia bacterium]
MAYLIFPLDVTADAATFWVGAINEDIAAAQVSLTVNQRPEPLGAWSQWKSEDGERHVDFQRLTLSGLPSKMVCDAELRVDGALMSQARTTTLPTQLPAADRPFTVLLGSCFYEPHDDGRAGRAYFRLPAGARPDIKVLCGDQVYLDNPIHQFIFPRSQSGLEKNFLGKYLKNWMQQIEGEGYRELLKSGANFFSADDHEYWNNAPFGASYLPQTWTASGRERWRAATAPLYQLFQTPALTRKFDVGQLSFLIADTRSTRDERREQFLAPEEFEKLRDWVDALRGPGVLTLGGAIFADRQNAIAGRVGDFGLPDYQQYKELVRILQGARHSLVLLIGDVHFGRVARCDLGPGIELIEVISSPLSLVSSVLGGKWAAPPDHFPAFLDEGDAGIRKLPIEKQPPPFKLEGDHFATLEFSAQGAKVRMTVKYWPIPQAAADPVPIVAFERLLQ